MATDTKINIRYSTSYSVYYSFDSVISGTLWADSLESLNKKKKELIETETSERIKGEVQLIIFSAVTKTLTEEVESRGEYVKFGKITNRYWGKHDPKEWYRPMVNS